MRILLVSHAYVTAENQKKLWALAAQPDVELAVVMPQTWHDAVFAHQAHVPPQAPFAISALPASLAKTETEQYHFYWSLDLGLRAFKPDVIYVEQGAGALVYTQSLLYRNWYAPQAKAIFFTWWNLPYRARWPLSAIEQFNLSQSQGAVAGNQEAAGILRTHGFSGPLLVLPQLGVDTDEYKPQDATELRRELGLDRFTVGYVGRFVEEKGIRVLLQALAEVNFDFQLLMLGRGPLEEEIRNVAAQHGWGDRLKIISGVGHSDMARYQNAMDAVVVHSLTRPFWKEQFGHVIVEAMACGVPVIGSNSAEVPNVIGEAGIVTAEGEAGALAEALNRLAASLQLRQQLGQQGRQRVLDHYTNERLAQKWIEFAGRL